MSSRILIIPVGYVNRQVLTHIQEAVGTVFESQTRIGDSIQRLSPSFDHAQDRYSAIDILYSLPERESERVLGVIDEDIYLPGYEYIYGLAETPGNRCVIALKRLHPHFSNSRTPDILFLSFAVKEAIHEIGHTLGLEHCNNPRCVMAFSTSLGDTAYKNSKFCRKCVAHLH